MKLRYLLMLSTSLVWSSISPAQAAGQSSNSTNGKFPLSTLSGGINLRAISGAPFSADVVRESTQVLADGTRVPVEAYGKMFRDAEGRTRSETEITTAPGVPSRHYVTIVDPVLQMSIVLDMQAKTAMVFLLPAPPPPMRPTPTGLAVRGGRVPAKASAIVAQEDIGASMLEGFAVTGSRLTRPAEAVLKGEKARNVMVETWFSPELKIELQSKTDDPKSGEVLTKLQNIVMAEPDRALFEAPADYTIKNISPSR